MTESQFQAIVIKWLRAKGFWAMKCQVPPAPTGTADVFFCYEGFYGWLECKKCKTSKFQPLQKEFIAKMDDWSYARVAYPANWEEIKADIERML